MSELSRRETLAGGGKVIAAAAVLPFFSLTNPAHAEEDADTALFHLVDQYDTAMKAHDELEEAWCDEIHAQVPPQYRRNPYSYPGWSITSASRSEKARDLEMKIEDAQRDYHSAAICIVKTPARSMRGVAAKMRISEGGTKWCGLKASALADAERLAGRAG